MKFKILLILTLFFLNNCEQAKLNKSGDFKKIDTIKYRNSGFALIYDDNLKLKKKLDNRSLTILHSSLKKKSYVKITNPSNNKSIIARVKSSDKNLSNFYNSVLTKRIAEEIELDFNEPFIEIILISKESTFIAKKSKTYDEEKEVAEKAPVDGIQIKDLNINNVKKLEKKGNKIFSYSIKVADFYYKDTALMIIDKIKKETSLKKLKVVKLSKTNYRVLIGPFNDIKSLKESFEKMTPLYFENLEILKNV
tara:strand:- start:42 stop:794 length:753 start_codon:yes stop_codon:yes gene_type:complete